MRGLSCRLIAVSAAQILLCIGLGEANANQINFRLGRRHLRYDSFHRELFDDFCWIVLRSRLVGIWIGSPRDLAHFRDGLIFQAKHDSKSGPHSPFRNGLATRSMSR